MSIAQVIVPLPVFDYLDYKIPNDETDYAIGDYVKISIGSRSEIGVIADIKDTSNFKRLKSIQQKYNCAPFNPKTLEFIQKAAAYTMSPVGDIFKSMLRGLCINEQELMTDYIIPYKADNLTKRRQEVIDFLSDYSEYPASDLRKEFSSSIIREMVLKEQLKIIQKPQHHGYNIPIIHHNPAVLGTEQYQALESFKSNYQTEKFVPFLVDGVTGSGKTELYLEMIAYIWQYNPDVQILILIPEIGLVAQTCKRFKHRFGVEPAIWHSQMSDKERKLIRKGVAEGSIKAVVGARSGIFLPFVQLGGIIVDEEHDSSYKQEEGFRYHGRDIAVMRANIEQTAIILASATPSLESFVNAEVGRYHKLQLRERFSKVALPKIRLIDLRTEQPTKGQWIAPSLVKAIEHAAFEGEQSLLFLNRRGYAPLMICRGCGYRIECPFCSAWVVYHRQFDFLKCHQCGQHSQIPEKCPSCGAPDKMTPCGPGVERLHEEVETIFPHLKSVILSSDHQVNPEKLKQLLDQIRNGEVDVLIGTQMVAKGHHFPHLTCVGIIDADIGLKGGDFRAFERSFQILEQVSGRAGREVKQGNVLIQTYNPEHPVMTALANHDRDQFLDFEAENRMQAGYPPFTRMAALILSSEDEKKLVAFTKMMIQKMPNDPKITLFGPAPAPIYLLRGRYRYRFLIKSEKRILPQAFIKYWLSQIKIPDHIRLHVDIDPINFL